MRTDVAIIGAALLTILLVIGFGVVMSRSLNRPNDTTSDSTPEPIPDPISDTPQEEPTPTSEILDREKESPEISIDPDLSLKQLKRHISKSRFRISDLQQRINVLSATREDLDRQVKKLSDSVPEDEIDPDAQRDGYVAYGSYATSVIVRKKNLRFTLSEIEAQEQSLAKDLRSETQALDMYERMEARKLAEKVGK